MKVVTAICIPALALGGCAAYVPDLEPEETFSYAEVATQIECETYIAATKINVEEQLARRKGFNGDIAQKQINIAFDTWAMTISIKPTVNFDASAGLGFATQTSATSKSFFKFLLGGGTSPTGVGYESFGNTSASNDYTFPVRLLFGPNRTHHLGDKNGIDIKVLDINHNLALSCQPPGRNIRQVVDDAIERHYTSDMPRYDLIQQNAVPNVTNADGFFGIYDFLERSFAVNGTIGVLPKSLSFSKEYKAKINVGITPGWYVATGNISPNAGVARYVDNIITVAFAPDDGKAKASVIPVLPNALTSRAQTQRQTSVNGVSPGAASILNSAILDLEIQRIGNRLN